MLRAAVVGSGGISKEHLSFLSGQSHLTGTSVHHAQLVGVCDLSPVSAQYAARTYGEAEAFTNLNTMLAEAKPEVVHILTPPTSHVPLATACLQAGSHVICEKPITTTSAELDALLDIAAGADRRVMESHNYRFNAGTEELAEALSSGKLGTLREVEVRIALPVTDPAGRFGDPNLPSPIHQLPAGVIHDFTTHFAYLLLHFAKGVHFDRIAAAWSNHDENPLFRYDNLDALLIGTGPEGPVHGRLRFDAGAGPDQFSLRVYGSDGWAETDLFQPNIRVVMPRSGGGQLSPIVNHVVNGASLFRDGVANVGRKIMQRTPYEGLHRMLAMTYEALATGGELPVTVSDMRATSRLVDSIIADKVRI